MLRLTENTYLELDLPEVEHAEARAAVQGVLPVRQAGGISAARASAAWGQPASRPHL